MVAVLSFLIHAPSASAADTALPRETLTFGNVSFGVQDQTNANFGQDKRVTRISGTDYAVDLNDTPRADYNFYFTGFLLNMLPVPGTKTATLETSGLLFGTKYRHEKDLNAVAVQANTGIRVSPFDSLPEFSVKPSVLAGLTSSGRDHNTRTLGSGMEFRQRVGADVYTARFGWRDAASFAPNATTTLKQTFSIAVSASLKMDEASRLSTSFTYRHANSNEADGDYDMYSPGISYSRTYAPPLGHGNKWRAGVDLTYQRTLYAAPDPGVDPNVTRQDHTFLVTITNEIPLDNDWSFDIEGDASRELSNLPNFVTHNFAFKVGFSRNF